MVQGRSGAGFAQEPLPAVRILHFTGGQNLDGDVAVQTRVQRLIDLAHAAFADLLHDLIVEYGLSDHRVSSIARRQLATWKGSGNDVSSQNRLIRPVLSMSNGP